MGWWDGWSSGQRFLKAKNDAYKFYLTRWEQKRSYGKLISKGYGEDTINAVIELLERYKYIDDEAFAYAYARDSIQLKRRGRHKLIYDLKNKGLVRKLLIKSLLIQT